MSGCPLIHKKRPRMMAGCQITNAGLYNPRLSVFNKMEVCKIRRRKSPSELQTWSIIAELMELNTALNTAESQLDNAANNPGLYTLESMDKLNAAFNDMMARRELLECYLDDRRDRGELVERPIVPNLELNHNRKIMKG